MEQNPYASPMTSLDRGDSEAVPRGGNLRRVASGLRYTAIAAVATALGSFAAQFLGQGQTADPAVHGAVVLFSIGYQLVAGFVSALGMILCLYAPRETRAIPLLIVALAGQTASVLIGCGLLGGVSVPPVLILVVLMSALISAGCFILFLHRLATILGGRELAAQVVLLLIWLVVWVLTFGLLLLSPCVGVVVVVSMGLYIVWNYLSLLWELASVADKWETYREGMQSRESGA